MNSLTSLRIAVLTALTLPLSTLAAVPTDVPSGSSAPAGGYFSTYFNNLANNAFSIPNTIGGSTQSVCGVNGIIVGFNTVPGSTFLSPQCKNFNTLLGSILTSTTGGEGQAVTGFNPITGAPIYEDIIASSQWKGTPPGNIYYNMTGNVGIGTDNPDYKLTVVGGMKSTILETMSTNTPTLSFHKPGAYATQIKLLPNNHLSFGGWSTAESQQNIEFGNAYMTNTSPTIFLKDTDDRSAMLHANSNQFYVLRGAGNNSTDWTPLQNGRWPLQIDLNNGQTALGGGLDVPGDTTLRANTTVLGSMSIGGNTTISGKTELGVTSQNYMPLNGNWNYTLQLNGRDNTSIGFHDANNGVSSIRYDNTNGFTIGGNDGWGVKNVVMPGNLTVQSKIKMTSQTQSSDPSDIVATKGYVDSKLSGNSGTVAAGQSCPSGQYVSGFDRSGNMQCTNLPPATIAGDSFGGMFRTGWNGRIEEYRPDGCLYKNPYTNGCSCPSGYEQARIAYDNGITSWYQRWETETLYCYKK